MLGVTIKLLSRLKKKETFAFSLLVFCSSQIYRSAIFPISNAAGATFEKKILRTKKQKTI